MKPTTAGTWPLIAALVCVALAACAAPGATGGSGSGAPAGSGVPAALGTFDKVALENTFDTTLTDHDLTETKRSYTADYRLPLGLEFTIDPADATQHLLETSLRPAEVAPLVGFADQAHLTRWFRRVLGVTPAAYRNSVQDTAR